MAGRELETIIRLRGVVDGSLDAAFKAAESKAAKIMKSLPKNAGAIMKSVGKAAVAGLTAATTAATAFAASSVKTTAEFDTAMSQVAATMGKTMEQMKSEVGEVDLAWGHFSGNLDEYAQEMGANTAFSATQAAEALNYMALAGYDTQKAMGMLPNVLNLAAAGAMDLAQASDMVTDAASALGLTTEQTAEMVDQMAQAASKSNTSVAQLGDAILTVGGTAANMKNGTVELSTALGILADNGIKAAEGGTHLRNMMLSLQKARSSSAAAWFEELDIHAYDEETGKLRELGDVFKDMNAAMAGMTDQQVDRVLGDVFKLTDLSAARAMLAGTKSGLESVDEQLMYSGVQWDRYKETALGAEDGVSALATQILSGFEGTGKSAAEIQEEIRNQFGMTAEDAERAVSTIRRALDGSNTRWDELSQSISEAWYSTAGFESSALKAGTSSDVMAESLSRYGITAEQFEAAVRQSGGSAEAFAESINEWSDSGASAEQVFRSMGVSAEEFQEILDKTTGAAQAMAGTQRENLQGDVTMLDSAFKGLQIAIGRKLTPDLREFVQFGTVGLSRLTAAFKKGGLNAALDEFSALLSTGLSKIVSELPGAVDAGIRLLEAIGRAVLDNADVLLESAAGAVEVFADGLLDSLPRITAAAGQLLSKAAIAIGKLAPRLVPKAVGAILDSVTAFLRDGDLSEGARGLLSGLAKGITESLGIIAEKGPELLSALIEAMVQNADLIAGAYLATTVGGAIAKEISSGLTKAMASAIGAETGLSTAISSGVSGAIKGVGTKISAVMTADIGTAMAGGSMATAGATIAAGLVGGIVAALGGAWVGKEIGKALFPEDAAYYDEWFAHPIKSFQDAFSGQTFEEALGDSVKALDVWKADVDGAIEGMADSVRETISGGLGDVFGPLGESLAGIMDSLDLTGMLAELTKFATAGTPIAGLIGAFQSLGAAIELAANKEALLEALGTGVRTLTQDAQGLWTAFAGAFGQMGQAAQAAFAGAQSSVSSFLGSINGGVQTAINGVSGWFRTAFAQIQADVQTGMSGAAAAIQTVLSAAQGFVATGVTAMQTKFTQLQTYLTGTFKTAWDTAWTGMGNIVTAAFDKAKAAVKGAISKVVSAINALIGGVNTISGAVGIPAIPLIPVPQFAEGGTVTSPTIAMVGEAGPETIVPHNNSDRSRQLLREAAAGVYGAQASRSPGSSYNITFAPTINGGGDPEETAEIVMEKFRSWYEQMKRDDLREAYAQ